jgi:hypothetical protein
MWRKMLLFGLLTLATLNPPAFLLAQNRPSNFSVSRTNGDFR